MNKKTLYLLHRINLPRIIANQTLGEQHTTRHRCTIGCLLMLGGIAVCKIHTDMHYINVAIEAAGAGVHGLGLTPFIEWAASIAGIDVAHEEAFPQIDLTLLDREDDHA